MPRLPLALGLLALAGCGAAVERDTARDARYDAPFPTIWNVVTEEVRRRYVGIHIEDAMHGIIETDYRVVTSLEQDVGGRSSTQSAAAAAGTTTSINGPRLSQYSSDVAIFRMTVRVSGPPWKVYIDGVAAKYDPSSPLPVPYQHGAIDEPPWVQQRIDNLTSAIYDRLKQYATKDNVKVAKKPEAPVQETVWKNLADPGLVQVIRGVRTAAVDRDTSALRGFMVSDFRWADGADTSAETAVAVWSADPSALRELATALDAGCAAEGGGDVVCPAGSGEGPRHARLRHVGASWKLVEFLR